MTAKAGFTLIEVLVVMALVGILLSVAALSLRSDRHLAMLEADAQRLADTMQIGQYYATVLNRPFGLDVTERGYDMLELRAEGWQPIELPYQDRSVTFRDGIAWLEPPRSLEERLAASAKDFGARLPEIVFTPSADNPIPPFTLIHESTSSKVVIQPTAVNRFEVALQGSEVKP